MAIGNTVCSDSHFLYCVMTKKKSIEHFLWDNAQ